MSLMFPVRSSSERYIIQRSRIVTISSSGSMLGAGAWIAFSQFSMKAVADDPVPRAHARLDE